MHGAAAGGTGAGEGGDGIGGRQRGPDVVSGRNETKPMCGVGRDHVSDEGSISSLPHLITRSPRVIPRSQQSE
jgi:hypothetical protein